MDPNKDSNMENTMIQTIGDYKINLLDELGRGQYGDIYRAKDLTGSEVAAKKFKLQVKGDPSGFQEKFMSSKEKMHSNLVEILYYCVTDSSHWVILELCETSLHDYLHKENPGFSQKIHIMRDITRGVQFLHDNSITDCDIQPGNILITLEEGTPKAKVTDYYLSSLFMLKSNSAVDRSEGSMGIFLPPELLDKAHPSMTDHASADIFSLGLLFSVIHNYDSKTDCMKPQMESAVKGASIGMRMLYKKQENVSNSVPPPQLICADSSHEDHTLIEKLQGAVMDMTMFEANERIDAKEVLTMLLTIPTDEDVIQDPKDMDEASEWLHQMVQHVNRKVPENIQHCTISTKYKKVVVNVSNKTRRQAQNFLAKACPKLYEDGKLFIIEQPKEPEVLAAPEVIAGMELSWVTPDTLEPVKRAVAGGDKLAVALGRHVPENHPYTVGSVGCFVKDEMGSKYILTANHIFSKDLAGSFDQHFYKEKNMQIICNTNGNVINLGDEVLCGASGQVDGKLVDVALIPVSNRNLYLQQNDQNQDFDLVLSNVDHRYLNQQVQKSGASGKTVGFVINTDFWVRVHGSLYGGNFCVSLEPNPPPEGVNLHPRHFAEEGDSGAGVTTGIDPNAMNEALGIVSMRHTGICRLGQFPIDATVCVGLQQCIKALSKSLGRKFQIYNPRRESGSWGNYLTAALFIAVVAVLVSFIWQPWLSM